MTPLLTIAGARNRNRGALSLPSSNRVNQTGLIIGSPENRASQAFTNVVLANSTESIPLPGNNFYFAYASAPVNVRPNKGIYNTYATGTGLELEQGFTNLEIQNPTNNPILYQIFVGFDKFIDKRVIIDQSTMSLVAFPTYPVSNASGIINIVDLSAQAFTDINGGLWYAVSREGIYVFNPDAGVTLNLQAAGAVGSGGPSIGVVYPTTTLRMGVCGDYSISTGGGNINAIVSEVYYSLPRT